jgi:hypothetical protein
VRGLRRRERRRCRRRRVAELWKLGLPLLRALVGDDEQGRPHHDRVRLLHRGDEPRVHVGEPRVVHERDVHGLQQRHRHQLVRRERHDLERLYGTEHLLVRVERLFVRVERLFVRVERLFVRVERLFVPVERRDLHVEHLVVFVQQRILRVLEQRGVCRPDDRLSGHGDGVRRGRVRRRGSLRDRECQARDAVHRPRRDGV